jgi:glycerol-3-phosphate dehydrogenase
MIDHWKAGGPAGAYSISGVKFTTSRLVAEKMIKYIFSNRKKKSYKELFNTNNNDDEIFFKYNEEIDKHKLEILKKVIDNESVIHLSDLVSRRTSISDNPKRAVNSTDELKKIFPDLKNSWNNEILTLKDELFGNYEV